MELEKLPFGELVELSEKCPGRAVYFLKRRIASSFHIFGGNYRELAEVLKALQHPDSMVLRGTNKRREHDVVMKEVGRLLHNFACAIETLGQHVRRLVLQEYSGSSFRAEYERRVKEMFHSHFAQFMQDLRDYAVHCELPPFSDRVDLKLDRGNVVERSMGITLEVDKLKAGYEWQSMARDYLEKLDAEDIDLLNLIEEYYLTVARFYEWLDSAIDKMHAEELSEFRAVTDEIGRRIDQKDAA